MKGVRATRAFVALAFAALGADAAAAQQNSFAGQASVGASIVSAVSVQKSQDLVLGEFRPSSAAGTVELNVLESGSGASRTSSGGVALAGAAFSAAEFAVSSHAGGPVHFTVVLPPAITIQRIGGSESMRVDGFRSNVRQDCGAGASASGCTGSPYTLLVGATLHVEPGQRAGNYVGTFTVTVNQS